MQAFDYRMVCIVKIFMLKIQQNILSLHGKSGANENGGSG